MSGLVWGAALRRFVRGGACGALLAVGACNVERKQSTAERERGANSEALTNDARAPWTESPLPASDVPALYRAEWNKAENRATCALIAPKSLGVVDRANPRAATFAGGWAVAYDLDTLRSAFGVAGTGAIVNRETYRDWPHLRRWSDGSAAGYGPEGGTGPNQLAYVHIAGQSCLYNVWSRLGAAHLGYLIDQLRFVAP